MNELVNQPAFKHLYQNNKNARLYRLLDLAQDTTNSRDGQTVAVYCSLLEPTRIFVRDWEEFKQKFTMLVH